MTGKQRMLNAYRGVPSDRVAIAPEFWYYIPARVMGVDMIRFQREIPFHLALRETFRHYNCEGWGVAFPDIPCDADIRSRETWIGADVLEVRTTTRTPRGALQSAVRFDRHEPSWTLERPVKDVARDWPAYEYLTLGDPRVLDAAALRRAWEDVGDVYLLEAWMGVPFFDYYAGARDGGLEVAALEFVDEEPLLAALHERYIDHMVRKAEAICRQTPIESLCIGCAWSCNSLIGPALWRRWDRPVLQAVSDTVHRFGRLLHVHFHGRSMETAEDFAGMGIDCVCPFERPPGGDVRGLAGLRDVRRRLAGRTTMNGNVHTVETLIRGTPGDVRREVCEVLEAFRGSPRVIVGTGDQVGAETPDENIHAMIDEAKRSAF